MELPEPLEVPIRRIRDYLSNLRDAILGYRPVAGEGIKVNEYPGQGTVISVDKSSLGVAIAACSPSGTFIFGSVDGVVQCIPTEACDCDGGVIDGGGA